MDCERTCRRDPMENEGRRERYEAARESIRQSMGFRRLPDRLSVACELPSNEAVRGAVETGMGATAISASVAAPSIEAGVLVQVGSPLPERAFTALRHRERHRSRAEAAFLNVARGASRR